MRKTRTQVINKAIGLGCKVIEDTNGNWFSVHVDAPDGMQFGHGEHTILAGCFEGNKEWKRCAWAEILAQLEHAELTPCPYDCDCRD